MQGYLYKRPKRALGRTWQQRFFSLIGSRDNPRLCYAAAEGGEVKGIYQLAQLAGCEVSIGDGKSGKQAAQVRGVWRDGRVSRQIGVGRQCCSARRAAARRLLLPLSAP